MPIEGVYVVVSKKIGKYNVIFYEGLTDSSGIVENIKLPTPKYDSNDLVVPLTIDYDMVASYNNSNYKFNINMYDGVCVIQNINIIPSGI